MTNTLKQIRECLVYPGEYTPSPEIETLLEELKIRSADSVVKPLINMDEYDECFKIEVVAPGVRREDIFIHVHENILSVIIQHTKCTELKKKLQIHEYEAKCMERHILLPENADTEFVSAEYRQGVLSLYIPKTTVPQKTINNQIVVY